MSLSSLSAFLTAAQRKILDFFFFFFGHAFSHGGKKTKSSEDIGQERGLEGRWVCNLAEQGHFIYDSVRKDLLVGALLRVLVALTLQICARL